MDDFIINIIFLFYYLKQWISCCPRSDRNRLQNMQKCGKNIHSLAHTAAPHVPFFVLPTFWHYPCSINEVTILNRPFYSYVLICQAFDLGWGWSWPCCDRDQYLVCIITKSFTFEKQQGLFHNRSPLASLLFKGLATKHATVKWTIVWNSRLHGKVNLTVSYTIMNTKKIKFPQIWQWSYM